MRVQSLILSAVASVLFVAMGTIAGIAAYLSRSAEDAEPRGVPVAVAAKPIDRGCRDCGVVVAVKEVELKGRTARKTTSQYEVRVRMSDGSMRTVTYSSAPAWKAGDRVRLQNGRVVG